MKKYYTRACNFYYGNVSKDLIKKKLSLPLCGNNKISFDKIEIITRNKKKISSQVININKISSQNLLLRNKIKKDIKKIKKKKIFSIQYI